MSAELLFGALDLAFRRFLFHRFLTMSHDNEGEEACNLSVMIPACNEALTLPDPLGDLSSQTVRQLEIICMDGASTYDTASFAIACGAKVVKADE